jgi:hypothetical protein
MVSTRGRYGPCAQLGLLGQRRGLSSNQLLAVATRGWPHPGCAPRARRAGQRWLVGCARWTWTPRPRRQAVGLVQQERPAVTGPLAQPRQRPRRRNTPNTNTTTTTTISTHNHVSMAASLVGAGAVQADATAAHPSKQLGHGQATSRARIDGRAARQLTGPCTPRPARRSGLAGRASQVAIGGVAGDRR